MKTTLPIPTETDECITLVAYLETLKTMRKIRLFTHVPNETYTKNWGTKMKNKRLGVRTGFPDYIVLTNRTTLFIEMKRTKGGKISSEQQQWIEELTELGLKAKVCLGYTEAQKFIDENL